MKRLAPRFERALQPAIVVGGVDDRKLEIHDQVVHLRAADVDAGRMPDGVHPTPQGSKLRVFYLVRLGDDRVIRHVDAGRRESQVFADMADEGAEIGKPQALRKATAGKQDQLSRGNGFDQRAQIGIKQKWPVWLSLPTLRAVPHFTRG